MTAGIRIQMSNSDGDDFVNCCSSICASFGDVSVRWTLPDRLVRNEQVLGIALREIQEELKDRVRAKERTRVYR